MTDKLTTETTNVTQAVRESYEQLAGIIASAMNAIITVNAAQHIVMFNQAAEKMFGVAEQEALYQPLDRFIPARFQTAHHRHLDSFGETKVSTSARWSLLQISSLATGVTPSRSGSSPTSPRSRKHPDHF